MKSFTENLFSSSTVLFAQHVELYRWDLDLQKFLKPDEELGENARDHYTAEIIRRTGSGFEYWLMVSSEDGTLLAHKISPAMNQRWANNMKSFTWNHLTDNGKQSSWCLRFFGEEPYSAFLSAYTQALWESLHQISWEKMKVSKRSGESLASDAELNLHREKSKIMFVARTKMLRCVMLKARRRMTRQCKRSYISTTVGLQYIFS